MEYIVDFIFFIILTLFWPRRGLNWASRIREADKSLLEPGDLPIGLEDLQLFALFASILLYWGVVGEHCTILNNVDFLYPRSKLGNTYYDIHTYRIQYQLSWAWSELFTFGYDGVSYKFLLLTVFLFPLVFLGVHHIDKEVKILVFFLLVLEFLLVLVFLSVDLFMFYLAFEIVLIPMIYLIAIWGLRPRRIKAIYYFFLYTFCGSLLMLYGLIVFFYEFGTTNMLFLSLFASTLSIQKQKVLWFLFFIPFAMKIPLFPFHIWLPEAHVEAPTFGSVILAGLLLKLGGYGMYRVLLGMLASAHLQYNVFSLVVCCIGAFYSSVLLLRQFDVKRIIAYSSVAHMSVATLGLCSDNIYGIVHGLLIMIAHGFSSSGLFFCIGMLYERFGTRLLFNFGGLYRLMPLFSLLLFFLCLLNFGFPLSANFAGEWVLLGVFAYFNPSYFLILALAVGFSIVYSMGLYVRLCTGELNVRTIIYPYYADLNRREFYILASLIICSFVVGIVPTILTNGIWDSVVRLPVVPTSEMHWLYHKIWPNGSWDLTSQPNPIYYEARWMYYLTAHLFDPNPVRTDIDPYLLFL